ncbi:hypothetical protein GC175_04120 [bacterium]|nr:hypothetical protein [bacterium]
MQKHRVNTPIPGLPDLTLGDFWSWAYSDLLNNRNRSIFAEFIVGVALGVIDTPRIEWDGVDLRYKGRAIEVKSSAYIQSWLQKQHSAIRFDIGPKQPWDAHTNTFQSLSYRSADCYVFCLFTPKDPTDANVLDVEKWHFYIVATSALNNLSLTQKSIGLLAVARLTSPVSYWQIQTQIDTVLHTLGDETSIGE